MIELLRKDILNATGLLQLCDGQDAGSEAATHAVYDMFSKDKTEAVLMVDGSNAFNSINREAFLHNTKVLCPALATFINNCYSIPSDLFLQGGKREQMCSKCKRLNDIAQEQGSSSWLTVLPIKQLGFSLSETEFWHAVYLRYGLSLKPLPSLCGCSKVYAVQHALSCEKGVFVTLSYNELRDNIVQMLQEVTNDVRIEPILQPLSREEKSVGGNVSVEVRADISARGFWCRGQRAFFDVTIFDPNVQRHENKALKRCYELNGHEKKRDYSSRILNVEQSSFTPLVFSITCGMGRECSTFVKRLRQMISLKRKEKRSVITYGIRCKISYALLRSSLLCVQGSCKMSSEHVRSNTVTFSVINLAKNNESLINIRIN